MSAADSRDVKMRRISLLICMAFINWIALIGVSAVEEGKPGVTGLSESLHDKDGEQCKRLAISSIVHIRDEEIVAL